MSDHLAAAGSGAPAVVVLHDWYGLLPHVRAACDELAAAGVTALAVDLYQGRSATDEAEAEQLMAALSGAEARGRISEAVRGLRRSGFLAPRVSGLGFSMGGMLALDLAKAGLFDAVVAYYAALPAQDAALPCPLLLHLAEVDDFDPPDAPRQFAAAVRAAGGSASDHAYPGTIHSFANADVGHHHAEAAALAWERTVAFLGGRTHRGGSSTPG